MIRPWTLLLGGLVLASCSPERAGEGTGSQATLELVEAMGGGGVEGFAQALEPRAFDFPRDHAAHPGFRTEWWYVTGNLVTETGRRFGTQFTLFRNALTPDTAGSPPVQSDWSTRQIYMGHFALTDVAGERFSFEERFSRSAVGLAGDRSVPFRVWLDDWQLAGPRGGADSIFPLEMVARTEEGTAIALTLRPDKPLVLQGDRGLSQKGPEPGNASFYYSFTRLAAEGQVVVGADTLPVSGSAWLDREWSTSALSPGQVGWDWFALQLDDQRELMVYRLRRADGTTDPLSEGILVDRQGGTTRLSATEFELETLADWVSPIDGARYPSEWRVRVPGQRIDLVVEPVLSDQELNVTVRYWEGAVNVRPAPGTVGPSGVGYVELTGYAGVDPRRR